jgi:DNA-binding NarL/FixJ family response regulator
MNFFRRLQNILLRWGMDERPSQVNLDDESLIELDEELQISLQNMAQQRQCSEGELVMDLIQHAIEKKAIEAQTGQEYQQHWRNLTFREQQVAMLICRGLTNRQIAAQLNISPETVKVHARQALLKLGFHSRKEFRISLCEWISQEMTPDR